MVQPSDFKEVNRVITIINQVLMQSAADARLERTRIERWRWDEPDITLTWTANDDINRSIHAVIDEASSKVKLEINAWQDKDLEGGKLRVRYWRHQRVTKLDFPPTEAVLRVGVKDCMIILQKWNKDSLKETTALSPQYTS